jgi:hypothetical protein
MASNPLRFHPQAEEEYLTALSRYRERSPIAAINFESDFGQAAEKIREAPNRWPIYFLDFLKYTLRQFPFSVIYQFQSSSRDNTLYAPATQAPNTTRAATASTTS